MSAHALVQSALDAHAGLAALVGTRIRADLARPDDDLPFVVFKRADLDIVAGMDGSLLGQAETFEVECWGARRSEAVNVAEQTILALAAAHLTPEKGSPDGIDPEQLDRVVVLTVFI